MAATVVFEPLEADIFERTTAVCLGTGRFLRAVLVPALVEAGEEVVLAQTRGTSFGTYMASRTGSRSYEVDTVMWDGSVETQQVPIAAVGSLGVPEGRQAFMALPGLLPNLQYVGVGITEAGITHNGRSIQDLAEFLHACFLRDTTSGSKRPGSLSVINTDNVPMNGKAISKFVNECDFTTGASDATSFKEWLKEHVVFHDTMVDRITSCREGVPEVPRAEPLPKKALVIEDSCSVISKELHSAAGVVVRTDHSHFLWDLALKLRLANATHTAMVYCMALGSFFRTDACNGHPHILPYLEALFESDLKCSAQAVGAPLDAISEVSEEWMQRLQHLHFGLETFFICQNASQKLAIRLLPSVKASCSDASAAPPSQPMIFAFAAALRFLTPQGAQPRSGETPPVFAGRLDDPFGESAQRAREAWEYVPGLSVRPVELSYDFKDGGGAIPSLLRSLGESRGGTAEEAEEVVWKVLTDIECLDPDYNSKAALKETDKFRSFSKSVAVMLREMLQGKAAMAVLADIIPKSEADN